MNFLGWLQTFHMNYKGEFFQRSFLISSVANYVMYCLQICDLQNASFQNNRYYHDSFRVKTLNEHSDAFTSLRTTWMVPSHFYYFYHFEKRRKLLSIACWLGYWHASHKLVFKMAHNCLNSYIVQSTLTMPIFLISSEANCTLFMYYLCDSNFTS